MGCKSTDFYLYSRFFSKRFRSIPYKQKMLITPKFHLHRIRSLHSSDFLFFYIPLLGAGSALNHQFNLQTALKERLSIAPGNARRNRNNQVPERWKRVIRFNFGFRPERAWGLCIFQSVGWCPTLLIYKAFSLMLMAISFVCVESKSRHPHM